MSRLSGTLHAISRCGSQFRSEAMAPHGLKGYHTGYLYHICTKPGISQYQLARQMLVNKSNIARQVAVLEDGGFITRVPSPADKRTQELYPTEKALQLLPLIRELSAQWDAILFDGLTEQELQSAQQLLEKLRGNAARWAEDR